LPDQCRRHVEDEIEISQGHFPTRRFRLSTIVV
jgi:hypothetical protein